MKISDFTLQEYNIAEPGMPPKMGLWKQASKGAKIGIGGKAARIPAEMV